MITRLLVKRIWKPLLIMIMMSLLAVTFFVSFPALKSKASGVPNDPIGNVVTYATKHWNWAVYNNPNNLVKLHEFQDLFQCSEFVARSIAAAGPIGKLTPNSDGYGDLTYQGQQYNLKLVSGLYQFLINSGVGTDIGTNLGSLAVGSVVIFGRTDHSLDFEHVAIVTSDTNGTIILTQHNWADNNVTVPNLAFYKDGEGQPMSVTHIVQVNYNAIGNGALSGTSILEPVVKMNAPAPYFSRIITTDTTLMWQPVNGAQGYEVSVVDVNFTPVEGVSTTSTTFTVVVSGLLYGDYYYSIQPVSSNASFAPYIDGFNYEPLSCEGTTSVSNIVPLNSACHTKSGTY